MIHNFSTFVRKLTKKQIQSIAFFSITIVDIFILGYLFYSFDAGNLAWSTTQISVFAPLQMFGIQSMSMYWFMLLGACVTAGLLGAGYYIGMTYSSDTIRYVLVISFVVIEILGMIDTRSGFTREQGYTWEYSYSYVAYSNVNQWPVIDFVIELATAKGPNGEQSSDGIVIAIVVVALLLTLFPYGWLISETMILTTMIWITWTNDVWPWIVHTYAKRFE